MPKTTHNRSYTPEYKAWTHMKERCYVQSCKEYRHYGERGITVCDRWLSFENFYSDMGDRPSNRHSLDRKDNDGDYSPENCRWATRETQSRNSRIQANNTSGVRGVKYSSRSQKWEAGIYQKKTYLFLGRFKDKLEAVNARKNAELTLWKEK